MKQNFKPFPVGKIFNPILTPVDSRPLYKSVFIKYPMRLNAMALDPSGITQNNNMVFTPGEIVFSVGIFTKTQIKTIPSGIKIDSKIGRETIVRHGAMIMKDILNYDGGFDIKIDADVVHPHSGLGSTGNILASVVSGINELFGKPIDSRSIIKFISQNYGEEINENSKMLTPVQCIGGSACSGNIKEGLIIIAGESEVIASSKIDNSYDIIIGIPSDFMAEDSAKMLELEQDNFSEFKKTGHKFSKTIAYNLVHKVLPSLNDDKLDVLGDLIYEYRFNMGSIHNCSFCYKRLPELSDKLREIKEKRLAEILALSSVGPAFFVVTKKTKACEDIFLKNNLIAIKTKAWNKKYEVTKK